MSDLFSRIFMVPPNSDHKEASPVSIEYLAIFLIGIDVHFERKLSLFLNL